MLSKTQQVYRQPQDRELWQKLYYKHQQDYVRRKLKAIMAIWSGHSRAEVSQQLGCSYKTLSRWIDQYLEGGLERLTQPITRQIRCRLSLEHQQELKRMVLEQCPRDYGIDKPHWTAMIISEVIYQRWLVSLKDSRIYEILDQLGASDHKVHRDYAKADPKLQKVFVEGIKKTGAMPSR